MTVRMRLQNVLLIACLLIAAPIALAHARPGTTVPIKDGAYLHGTFVMERHLAGFDKPLKSTGQFALVPARGLVWQTTSPFPGSTILTDHGITNIDADGTAHKIGNDTAQFGVFINLISSVLAGNWSALESRFDVQFSPPDEKIWQVRLTPFSESAIGGQIIDINASGTRFVDHVILHKPGGDFDDITLSDQTISDLPLPDDFAKLMDRGMPGVSLDKKPENTSGTNDQKGTAQ